MKRNAAEREPKFNARGHSWKAAWNESNCTRCYLPNTEENRARECRGSPEPIQVDLYWADSGAATTGG
jgi:hypothetical protein